MRRAPILALIGLVGSVTAGPLAAQQTPGLVSYWPGNGNTLDAAGANNGTIIGPVTYGAGPFGQEAFQFSGFSSGGVVQIPDALDLQITGSITLSAWIYFTGPLPPMFQEQIVFRGDNRGGLDPYFLAVTQSGAVEFQVQDAANNTANIQAAIPANQFVLVQGSLDNTTGEMNLFINGALAAQTFTTVRPFAALDPGQNPGLGIGNVQDPSAYTEGFDGEIGQVRIFNRSLPAVQPDFNNDGRADCLFQSRSTGNLAYWLMQFTNRASGGLLGTPNPGSSAWQVADIADLNGDDEADLLFQNSQTGYLGYWLLNGTQLVSSGELNPPFTGSTDWQLCAVADLNGDGRPDLIFQKSSTGDLAYWLMDGIHQIGHGLLAPSNSGSPQWKVVGCADLNGDGWPDLVFQNQSTGQLAYWLIYGTTKLTDGLFSPSSPGSAAWKVVGVTDVSGDGRPDLVFQNSVSNIIAYWFLDGAARIGSGQFSPNNPGPDWRLVLPH